MERITPSGSHQGRHRKQLGVTNTRRVGRVILWYTIFALAMGAIFVGGYTLVWYLISDDKPTLLSIAPHTDFTPVNPSAPSSLANIDKECSDFFDQDDAQKYYEAQGGPRVDPDSLDMDHDGLACENYDYSRQSSSVPPTTKGVQKPKFHGTDTSEVNAK